MNPSQILPRETRHAAPVARKLEGPRADFSLPADDTRAADGRQSRDAGRRDQADNTSARSKRMEDSRIEDAQGNDRSVRETQGSERSREVRQNAHIRRGEGAERRSARADEVSNRDNAKICSDDCAKKAEEPEQPAVEQLSAEEAALLTLAEAQTATGLKPESAVIDSAEADASPAEVASGEQVAAGPLLMAVEATPVVPQPVTIGALGPTAESPDGEVKSGEALKIGEAAVSPGSGRTAITDVTVAVQDAGTGIVTEETGKPAPEPTKGEALTASKSGSDDTSSAPARTGQETKPEVASAQPQTAAARLEPLPPGLIGLPDNARALLAQEIDGKPGLGPQHGGPRAPEPLPTSLAALPIEIGFRALSGTKRFDIRLDPPELGRVDVSLSFDKEGEVTAKLTVDRVETLHLLQRDARTLERAFDQAGLRTSDAGVQISLSDRNTGGGNGFQAEQERARGAARRDDAEPVPQALLEMTPLRRARLGGVDLNV